MDVRDAVALSLLPVFRSAISRARLADVFQRALRRGGATYLSVAASLAPAAARPPADQVLAAADRALSAGVAAKLIPIVWGGESYPVALAAVVDPPIVLWVRGVAAVLSRPAVAIVGSRAASPYAREVAAGLAAALASRGIVVVSGLARGVDSAAHRGALEAGETIAVLGSGADVIYPPEHAELAAEIARHGAVVSELPPGAPPRAHHFPLRNRIISGLSLAVVIAEASERSGSLITAACGLEQGREVMAVPGNVLTGRNRGAHALLRDGAKIVESADDILEEFPALCHLTENQQTTAAPGGMAGDSNGILACFTAGEPCSLDEIAVRTGLGAGLVLSRLAELELAGLIRRGEGGWFVRSGRTC